MSYCVELNKELVAAVVGIRRGIEKEGLRVDGKAFIAQTPHPASLGSTLTHPSITTDYSEALLEFVTPTLDGVEEVISHLGELHRFTSSQLKDEYLWPASMPCRLAGDASIPIAEYGSSNVGQTKHIYRRGLAHRYGRTMQSIAGIHFNFSLSNEFWQGLHQKNNSQESLEDFKSRFYFALIRNFRRYSWILHYLFGASPVLDQSFVDGQEHRLKRFGEHTMGLEYATSLRMSDLGYQNSAQQGLKVSYNSLDDYVQTLGHAVNQAYADYEKIGVKVDGEYRQLNTNILQLENEYYSDIRPKRVIRPGEKPIHALKDRGVEYIEVRILDINPYLPYGIDAEQVRFMDSFLLHCLLAQCPQKSTTDCEEISRNQNAIIERGRDPSLQLLREGEALDLKTVANDLLDDMQEAAHILDQSFGGDLYGKALQAQRAKVGNPDLTPSGKLMQQIKQGGEFLDIVFQLAEEHKDKSMENKIGDDEMQKFHRQAAESLIEQERIEQSDTLSFDEYLAAYNAQ